MRLKSLGIILVVTGLLFSGCADVGQSVASNKAVTKVVNAPTPHVQGLIDQFQLQVVDYAYTKKAVANGTRNGAKALLVDARPNPKYFKGTIPSSISIPDTQIDKYIGQVDKVAKDKEILVFCGGWGCEKSPIVAGHLKSIGFTNVKLYQAGVPEWAKKSYLEIGLPVAQSAFKKDSALFMDARPRGKYLGATIPGALYMNDTELEKLAARFPTDKNTPIIAFCGGYQCHKSHVVANMLIELGYKKVKVFAGGLPAWKKADMRTTGGAKKAVAKTEAAPKDVFVDGVKVGLDEGTVDGEWYKALILSGKVPANITLVDVRDASEYEAGHMKDAINIEAGKLSAAALAAKLPKGQVSIFVCGSGARGMEAYIKLQDAKFDVSKVMYFDANINCDASNNCEIEVNEPLG